ncbi:MAG: thiamine phosphate synthase [Myxococcales bacterium]|nr:thiamine phosphate synthase [Myxococcales bacterium]
MFYLRITVVDARRLWEASDNACRLHVITDARAQSRWTHIQLAEQALGGGARIVQLREKGARSTQQYLSLAEAVTRCCLGVPGGAIAVVNDRVDVALAAGAHGVHLGVEDLPLDIARKMAPERIIGATAHTRDEVRQAQQHDIDYLGIGPVFGTTSKVCASPPLGLDGLRDMVRIARVPVIAIGSISPENIGAVLRVGAYGVAVLSYVTASDSPRAATERCVQAIREVCHERA